MRYSLVTAEKAGGITYTPERLATFVAKQVVRAAGQFPIDRPLRIFDPAVGHGELLCRLIEQLDCDQLVQVEGFDIDREAVTLAERRLQKKFPKATVELAATSFLDRLLENEPVTGQLRLAGTAAPMAYDFVVANPPYVRTQVMGSRRSRKIATEFGLSGRVDLYHAFLLGIARVLAPTGVAGIIVPNRFMTTKSGALLRRHLCERLSVRHIWDLGDTKLFDAAVLPAVVVARGCEHESDSPAGFTSAYETSDSAETQVADPIGALEHSGVAGVPDGRRFRVRHGRLQMDGGLEGVWRLATDASEGWLASVERRTWARFGDIGSVRVGVKTCADRTFIRTDWDQLGDSGRPELLRPLTTHRVARRFRPAAEREQRLILYPHEVIGGVRRAVELAKYPRTAAYLEKHRTRLEARRYVGEAGRKWYEIWVPQDPRAWELPKLVFRDIAEKPTFWLDLAGTVVNGDCYWLVSEEPERTDLLWLAAAVGNSTFVERFYDLRFPNRLYASRRRFITQYVQEFPLPDPATPESRLIVDLARWIWELVPSAKAEQLERQLDSMVWQSLTGKHRPPGVEAMLA